MAKKYKKPTPVENREPAQEIPKFEIGVKGDDFDKAYSAAVKNATADTDKLLKTLSREQQAEKFNFLSAILPFILTVIIAFGFIGLSRGDMEGVFDTKLSLTSILDGSYTEMLDRVYNETLPYGDYLEYAASLFSFGSADKPVNVPVEELPEEDTPSVTEPTVTEPVVTTAETTTTEITTVTTTTEATTTEATTTPMLMLAVVNEAVNVRTEPSTDGDRLGQLRPGDEVEVMEILDNGWYRIVYNGGIAYAYGEYMTVTEMPEVTLPDFEGETLYASKTVIIRLTPDFNGVNLGYFVQNEPVYVIETVDGWARVVYGSAEAYVRAEELAVEPIVTAAETEEEEVIEEETSEEIIPEESDEEVTTAVSEETAETTTTLDLALLYPDLFGRR